MPKSAKQLPPTIVLEPLAMMALDHTAPSAEGEEIEVTGHDVDNDGSPRVRNPILTLGRDSKWTVGFVCDCTDDQDRSLLPVHAGPASWGNNRWPRDLHLTKTRLARLLVGHDTDVARPATKSSETSEVAVHRVDIDILLKMPRDEARQPPSHPSYPTGILTGHLPP